MDSATTLPTNSLSHLNVKTLKALVRRLDLSKKLTRSAELLEALEQSRAKEFPLILDRLTDIEKKLLAEAVHASHPIPPSAFSAKYGAPLPFPLSPWSEDASLLRLFLFSRDDEVYLMEGFRDRLRSLLPEPECARI